MLFSHLKRLYIIGPSLILALPQLSPSSTPTPQSLPSSLQSTVPECAQNCLESALFTSFPVSCTSQEDLECLCSRYNTRGSSLGEVALGCLYASCPSVSNKDASAAFNVCVGQKDAVLPTQSALTVTALKTSLSTSTPTTISSSSTSSTRSTSSTVPTIQSTPTSKRLSTFIKSSTRSTPSLVVAESVLPTPSVTLQASAASSENNSTSSAPQGPQPLQTGQIVGIAVAGAAVIILAVGAMVLSICLRRRHERRIERKMQKMAALAEKKNTDLTPPSRFPLDPSTPPPALMKDPRGGGGGIGVGVALGIGAGIGVAAAQLTRPVQRVGLPYPYASPSGTTDRARLVRGEVPKLQTSRVSPSQGNGGDLNGTVQDIPLEEIGLAISPEADQHVSPESFVSTRTVSRLLPDKPVPALEALQKQARHRSSIMRPDSVLTTTTLFEEDTPIERPEPPKFEPILPIPPLKVRNSTQSQPARPGARAYAESYVREIETPLTPTRDSYFRKQQSSQPEPPRNPQSFDRESRAPPPTLPLSLNIPARHSRFQPTQLVSPIQEVNTPQWNQLNYEPMGRSSSNSSLDMSYIPDYYISPEKLLPRAENLSVGPEMQRRPSKSPKPVNIKSKASSTTVSRSTSVTSRTRRESASSNTTFESADINDPTPEDDEMDKQLSPVAESPISNLRYPKVPRASNQAVPRSPRSPISPKSPQRQKTTPDMRTESPTPSLLVKRRGEKRAQELEDRFYSPASNPQNFWRNVASQKPHKRGSSDESMARTAKEADYEAAYRQNRRSKSVTDFDIHPAYRTKKPESEAEALKSPLWVPKLTPTRQGDELFISVV